MMKKIFNLILISLGFRLDPKKWEQVEVITSSASLNALKPGTSAKSAVKYKNINTGAITYGSYQY